MYLDFKSVNSLQKAQKGQYLLILPAKKHKHTFSRMFSVNWSEIFTFCDMKDFSMTTRFRLINKSKENKQLIFYQNIDND